MVSDGHAATRSAMVGTADNRCSTLSTTRSCAAWAFYAVGFGLAAATRRDRRGMWWVAAVLLTGLIAMYLTVQRLRGTN
jgi:hypothetical protein